MGRSRNKELFTSAGSISKRLLWASLILLIITPASALAQYNSSNYKAEEVYFGAGGELETTSTSYKAQSLLGSLGVQTSTARGSYNFDGVNDFLTYPGEIFTDHPYSWAVWFKPDDLSANDTLLFLGDDTDIRPFQRLRFLGATAGDPISASSRSATGGEVNGTSTLGLNGISAWASAAGSLPDSDDRRGFFNGDNKGTNGTVSNFGVGEHNRFSVGRLHNTTGGDWFDGHIAYVFVWDTGLSDAEVANWHTGSIPQSDNLVAAYDLSRNWGSGPIPNIVNPGTFDLTIDGATFDQSVTTPITYNFKNYQNYAGFLTPNEPFLELKINTSTVSLGTLDAATTKTGTASFHVRSYLDSTYSVQNLSPSLTMTSGANHTIPGMSSQGASVVGTEQFGMNLRANTSPTTFGADPSPQPDGTFAYGSAAAGYDSPNQYKYVQGDTIAQTTSSGWGQTNYTLSYIANIAPLTPAGSYKTVQDLVVVATY